MINTLIGLSRTTSAIGMGGAVLFFGMILLRRSEVTGPENAPHYLRLLRLARGSSIGFAIMAWLMASCQPWETCLQKYSVLGDSLQGLGEDWLHVGLGLLLTAILLNLSARESSERTAMCKITFSSLMIGIIFWLFSALLIGL